MKKKTVLILVLLLLIVSVAGVFLFNSNYVLINGTVIDRDASDVVITGGELPEVEKLERIAAMKSLDLRALDVSVEFYDMLCQELPGCEIRWNVPYQGDKTDNSVTEISVRAMTPEYEAMLQYFPNLQTVDARECQDYDALLELIAHRPDLQVIYNIDIGNMKLRETTTECVISNENVHLLLESLPYLPELKTVNSDGCTDYEALMAIREARPELTVNYSVVIGKIPQAGDATVLTLDIADAGEALELLQYFPNLSSVTFNGSATDYELMYDLMTRYPDVVMDWRFSLFGVETGSLETELLLNDIPMESTAAVEDALKYFYNLTWVEMCQCGIPSEEMDALWKRHPETRFVWAIPMGNYFVRTDVKAFIPFKFGYHIDMPFYDTQARELKYLVDLECLDLGHMRMTDISFLQYMPKLRFLILADVVCEDFSYMAGLTNLEYIELFRSKFDDVELLMNMKNLRELNIGWTNLKNPEKLKEMTWLTRLWASMNGMTGRELEDLRDSLPNTLVYINSVHPTEGGWRGSDLYCEMRDMLGMFYMK